MKWVDYHIHSKYSMDSTEEINKICSKAVENGIFQIAITDHVEMQDPKNYPDFQRRESEILTLNKQYFKSVVIKSGVEIGQAHIYQRKAKDIILNNNFDFIIGSIHETEAYGSPAHFVFNEDNIVSFFDCYFSELCHMAEFTDYDVLGHVTYPFRYVPVNLFNKYNPDYFIKDFRKLFQIVISREKGIEINTSSLRTWLKDTMPSLSIVKLYHDMGGEIITVGSDGHSIRSVFSGIPNGYKIVKQAGFDQIATFSGRKCEMVKI